MMPLHSEVAMDHTHHRMEKKPEPARSHHEHCHHDSGHGTHGDSLNHTAFMATVLRDARLARSWGWCSAQRSDGVIGRR
jgi:hypothetical protein